MIESQLADASFDNVLHVATDLESGLKVLGDRAIDVVLLDLGLPDSDGLLTYDRIHNAKLSVPIVVLTANADHETALEAIRRGAQDYIVKDELSGRMLARVIQYAIERKQRNLEKDRLNAELTHKTAELEAMMETQKRFLGMASHDLRNPLTLIMCYLDLFVTGGLGTVNPAQDKAVQVMRKSCEQMLAMLNDLLDINAIESGKLELKLRTTDLKTFLIDCQNANAVIAEAKSISIVLFVPDGLPPVELDVARMSQVFNNLISNAIKFSHPGSVVTIAAETTRDKARISVSDKGLGIPKEEVCKLFMPFAHLSVKATAGEKSTGLGLSIVRKLVQAHHGTVSVASEPSLGTTFTVEIPLVQASL
jgi:signal transduction histidine kinase